MKTGDKKGARSTTGRQEALIRHIIAGKSNAAAYRLAYNPKLAQREATDRAWRTLKLPWVRDRLEQLKAEATRKPLLSLNDRLAILAEIAQDKKSKQVDRTRAIDVYSKISGDQAPERHEHSGPAGTPIAVAAAVTVHRVPVAQRIAALRAAKLKPA